MDTTTIPPEAESAAKADIATLTVRVGALAVTDAASFEAAGQERLALKRYLARVDEICDPAIAAGHNAHKAALAVKAKLADPAKKLDADLQRKRVTWQQAEERRLAEIAREAERVQREAAEAAQLEEAVAAEQAGDHAAAESIVAAPIFHPPVIAAPVAKTAGISVRKTWTYRIDNEALVPRQFLTVDAVKLRKYVVAMGAAANVPGVTVYQVASESVRT